MKTEIWKEIEGYCGYEVSDLGRVRSRVGNGRGGLREKVRLLKPKIGYGYTRFPLTKDGKTKHFLAHRLVLTAFVGECPDGMEGCHNDGNRDNNRLCNLRWDTRVNNIKDRSKHGTNPVGEKNVKSKLKEPEVVEIRRLRSLGVIQSVLGKMFKVNRATISRITTGKQWVHI